MKNSVAQRRVEKAPPCTQHVKDVISAEEPLPMQPGGLKARLPIADGEAPPKDYLG